MKKKILIITLVLALVGGSVLFTTNSDLFQGKMGKFDLKKTQESKKTSKDQKKQAKEENYKKMSATSSSCEIIEYISDGEECTACVNYATKEVTNENCILRPEEAAEAEPEEEAAEEENAYPMINLACEYWGWHGCPSNFIVPSYEQDIAVLAVSAIEGDIVFGGEILGNENNSCDPGESCIVLQIESHREDDSVNDDDRVVIENEDGDILWEMSNLDFDSNSEVIVDFSSQFLVESDNTERLFVIADTTDHQNEGDFIEVSIDGDTIGDVRWGYSEIYSAADICTDYMINNEISPCHDNPVLGVRWGGDIYATTMVRE